MNTTDPSNRLTPPILDSNLLREEVATHPSTASSGGALRSNKFSFSNFFSPISGNSQTPSISSESPSVTKWASRVSSFVGGLLDKKGSPPGFEELTGDRQELEATVVHSSPETVRVMTSTPISFGLSAGSFNDGSGQEIMLPQQSFFQAGDRDRKVFVTSLIKRLEEAKNSKNLEDQIQKDINRIAYFLNGKKVQDVKEVKDFLGEAAEAILPILSQTIPNVATDLVVQSILETAPVDTTHGELAMSDSKKSGTSISINKKEGNAAFHIEVETKGVPTVFFKKIERNGTPDFEFIPIDEEATASEHAGISGEGRQFITLELEKGRTNAYSMSCSNLFRSYKIQASNGN